MQAHSKYDALVRDGLVSAAALEQAHHAAHAALLDIEDGNLQASCRLNTIFTLLF
ncbi:hypothetical protein [Massilia genomosp. 1]|uniref:hypothetical protein n=1 Tax=Massilia genomosp. 1 TaxID=2609280 RepID=UPI001420F559|nr:hypothetical protein [Massilia genomosp. 1]